ALRFDGDLFGEVAVCDGGGDLRDVANLVREVRGHVVDGVGEIAPRAADALHICLTAELSFRADFACNTSDFRRKRAELRDHRVDGLRSAEELSLEWTAVELDGHRPRQVAARDGADDA